MEHRIRGAAVFALLVLPLAASLARPAASHAEEGGRPALADEIERSLDGFFIFTTGGNGQYSVYQLLSGGRGLTDDGGVVCMGEQCYFPIVDVSEAQLGRVAATAGHRGCARQAFRAARTAYRTMQRSSAGELSQASTAWRDALKGIGPCLNSMDACSNAP